METAENKYITVAYKLYTTEDGKRDLVEETAAEHPFQFISGLGTTLEAFESQIVNLHKGDKFEFTIPFAEAVKKVEDFNDRTFNDSCAIIGITRAAHYLNNRKK